MTTFYAKSLEEDFATKTLKGRQKATCQTIQEIVCTHKIKPNTKSFGRKQRLACTILSPNYLKTYRPQGIIFTTTQEPDYVIPFDLALITAANHIIVHYYRIKNALHLYYNRALITGFEQFIFKNFQSMKRKYKSPKEVWRAVNEFRKKHDFKPLTKQKFRLAEYNEAIFNKAIQIKPIAVFGYTKKARAIAAQLHLPCFRSAKEFYTSSQKPALKS